MDLAAAAIEESIRAFIITDLGWNGDARDLTSDYPLVDERVIDSLGVLEIAGFIEAAYGVDVDEQDLIFDNFSCLSALARYVRDRRSERPAHGDADSDPEQVTVHQ